MTAPDDLATGGTAVEAVSPDLVSAYRNALYRIEAADGAFVVRNGTADPRLDRLFAAHGASVAALITADNPRGSLRDPAENRRAEAALAARIAALGLAAVPTVGIDPKGVWPDEPGRLIFGLDRDGAIGLARAFDQDALVLIRPGEAPELVMARPSAPVGA